MEAGTFGLLDAGLSFGVLVAYCVWQLISTNRAKQRRIVREKAEREGRGDALP